jgi:molecular chaperone HscB
MQNHFDLFQLPPAFALDMRALERAYHEVQGRVHPDKFAHAGDAEKRVAMQWATRANEAYRTLKDPLKRARYLCELNGVDLQIESNTAMPRDFLMQQMEWREALEEAKAEKDIPALERLSAELDDVRSAELAVIGKLLDQQEFQAAALAIRKLMFLDKFADEVGLAFETHC